MFNTLWRYGRGLALILIALALGKGIALLLPFSFPGSIIGMLLLFMALNNQWLRAEWLHDGAGLMLKHMSLLFIPVAVGLLAWLQPLRESLEFVAWAQLSGIPLMLLAVGWIYQRLDR